MGVPMILTFNDLDCRPSRRTWSFLSVAALGLILLGLWSRLFIAQPAELGERSQTDTFRSLRSVVGGQVEWDGGWPKASNGLLREGSFRVANNESAFTNLLPDVHYITSFPIEGLSNQILSHFNLLHLAFLIHAGPSPASLTPILPPFTPHFGHLFGFKGSKHGLPVAPMLRFSQVFDIDRLAAEIGMRIVEWGELKEGKVGRWGGIYEDEWVSEEERRAVREQRPVPEDWPELKLGRRGAPVDTLGCWGVWMSQQGGQDIKNANPLRAYYDIEFSTTPLPSSLLFDSDHILLPSGDDFVLTPNLILPAAANFFSPPGNLLQKKYLEFRPGGGADRVVAGWNKNQTLADVAGPDHPGWIPPSTHVTCLDNTFYASEHGEYISDVYEGADSWLKHWGPWSTIATHAHWAPDLLRLSTNVLRRILRLDDGAVIPTVITVHIRRTDFMDSCRQGFVCLPVSVFVKQVDAMRAAYVSEGRPDAKEWPVVVTTDDESPEYTSQIDAQGWFRVDHVALQTRELYGPWAPPLIDNVVLSLGKGFIGVEKSTMSALALRRVQDWNGGKTMLISRWATE